MDLFDSRPIIACSSGGMEKTAVTLLRLSGFKKFSQIERFFSIKNPEPRRATVCHLLEGTKIIDQIVLTYFQEPRSYTGENLLELGVHGNQLNVQRVLNLFISSNLFRLAHPGEFSYRAWKNNKITLSELEGLDLFLNAPSRGVLDQASKLMGGELTQTYLNLRENFLKLKAAIELSLDFLEDVGEEAAERTLLECLDDFAQAISALHGKTQGSLLGIMAPDIVLAGKTNAGKSSLFNRFLQESRSIVAPEEGTTRDYISETIFFQDIQFRLIDTAGVREAAGRVEQEGIDRAINLVNKAFYKILLIDPRVFKRNDVEPFRGIHFDLVLLTHQDIEERDLPEDFSVDFDYYGKISLKNGPIEPLQIKVFSPKNGPIEPPKAKKLDQAWRSSPQSGSIEPRESFTGLEILKGLIERKYLNLLRKNQIIVPRQQFIINACFSQFQKLKALKEKESDIALLSSELNLLGHLIEELIGVTCTEDVLGKIFSQFCIGK